MTSELDVKELVLQWIKGDKIGNVETVVSQDSDWTQFKSGARISTGLINEFMIPLDGEPLDLNPLTEITGPTGSNGTGPGPNGTEGVIKQVKENPIKTLFDKQKKTDKASLELSFSINIPTSDIFSIISMAFDGDEVEKELKTFIENQINENDIKKSLADSINSLIFTKYKSKKK